VSLQKKSSELMASALPAVFPRLWRYCLVLTGKHDLADDLAQNTSLRAMEKADLFEPGTHLDRWLFRMAQNLWFNELRQRKTRREDGSMIDAEMIADKTKDVEANYFGREVLLHVMALSDVQRTAVLLVYVEGYSYQQAADILEVPIGTMMSRLSDARRKLASGPLREEKT
jgi:RNA polymerase sigma-70 factor, ECF subfamily